MNDALKDTASHKIKPKEYDLVLGGNNPPPVDGAVLGGIEGVKSRLASDNIQSQISALSEAFNYGDVGLDLVIDALSNYRREVRQNADRLLQQRDEKKAKDAVNNYKFWSDFEYPYDRGKLPTSHSKIFAHRKVEDFNIEKGITDPVNTAYALRDRSWRSSSQKREKITKQFNLLIQNPKINKLEALVFGYGFWNLDSSNELYDIVNTLFDSSEQIPNLKALFIGDIEDRDMMISSIEQSDISPILAVYPNLEILHLRGGQGLRFNSGYSKKHDKLKVIRIESGGLPREAINGLCALDLPALEYLELWMGTEEYGGTSTVDDLIPIIKGEAFPNLRHLGLRNAEYTNEIVFELVKYPLIKRLIELDLSLGTLDIEGAEALVNCSAVNELDTLNISDNWLGRRLDLRMPELLQLDCITIFGEQRMGYPGNPHGRYCSVRE
ncbi:conserved hypothetical protein [Hyella patelloides LEGE 07179]|uniref:Uncharacterized protein n=1 Tax=Hyella patelloides LEGE 07179 TaxID=945734 RepID=A0A563VP80_9CYAN|nr:HEAT repeat domain-containing protein [Hyella patelloides]VEP13179.1 conserved hypothetical protein [Hyella patelloides LEGE 07179]